MATKKKLQIARAITKVLNWNYELPTEIVETRIKVNTSYPHQGIFSVPYEKHLNLISSAELHALKEELKATSIFTKHFFKRAYFHVEVDLKDFIADVLTPGDLHIEPLTQREKVLIDFSSPNIAKPFHMGHLRSTVIGNFIFNLNKFLGNEVVRINYIGDWGVQFGLLQYGIRACGFKVEDFAENPIAKMLEAYVKANELAEESAEVYEHAKKTFHDLEFADEDCEELKQWRMIRECSIKNLAEVYKKIGVEFDEYQWESDFSIRRIRPLVEKLKEIEMVEAKDDGALMATLYGQTIPIVKQDGTSLYLTRDLAAALDRYERHKFDKAYYVVDAMQRGHFVSLKEILKSLDPDLAQKIYHVPFGRVVGMSTRKGKAVWLNDILEAVHEKMELKQKETPTTKVTIGGEVTETLAKSCLIAFDLKHRRTSHYEFDLNTISELEGFTGGKLQYCHCRLHSLEQNCGVTLPSECRPELLMEKDAIKLVNAISRFRENLIDSYRTVEPCILMNYLFDLSECVNRAFPKLKVKDQDPDVAAQRLLLFSKAKQVLNVGMKIAGMKPLNEM